MAGSLLLACLGLILAVIALFSGFSAVPFVGPLFYGLLFLPLYLLSLVVILAGMIGLLYYPPLLAHRRFDIRGAKDSIAGFIRSHGLALVMFTPLLLCAALTLLGSVFVLHHAALKMVISFSEKLLPHETLATISAVPSGLMDLNNWLFAGLNISRHEILMNNLLLSHHAGGIIIGLSLSLISVVLLGMAISIVATLATETYLMIRNDRLPSAMSVAAFSASMAGILLCLLLLRRLTG
jgi:hypothetical protein